MTRPLAQRIRTHVVRMTSRSSSSHVGAGLSLADILAVLYGCVLRVDPRDARNPDRDRFILSKGHAAAALYAVLAECGFFPATMLDGHCRNGSTLCGHASHLAIPGVEFSTGSLGHGLPVGTGMALAGKRSRSSHRVFVLMSDGECDEGSIWEAALFAAHHQLDNLVAIIDYNKLQSLGTVHETLALEPLADKWASFGWSVAAVDGHCHASLAAALASVPVEPRKPLCLIAHTIKGKGVSFMENSVLWHYRSPQGGELEAALHELEREPCETHSFAG